MNHRHLRYVGLSVGLTFIIPSLYAQQTTLPDSSFVMPTDTIRSGMGNDTVCYYKSRPFDFGPITYEGPKKVNNAPDTSSAHRKLRPRRSMPSGLDTGKPATTIHYDALDREIRKGSQRFDGQWQFVDRVYDQRGRLEKVSLPFRGETASHWNTYSYDAYNRPVGLTEASGKTSAWHYGRLWTMETKDGITTTRTFDQLGAVVKAEDPGGIITYEIRPDGQPSRIVAPGNAVTSFSYDNFGRRLIIDDPSVGKQYFSESYASDGSRTFLTREPNGHMITSKYDKYGRLLESKRDELNTEYRYNADGDLSTVKSNNGTAVNYTYDAYGRIATARTDVPDGVFLSKSYKYADGNLASIQYTSQKGGICTENYVYANGYNTEVKLNNTTSIWKLTEENGLGQPTKAVTGVLARTYSYDAFGQPTGRTAGNIQNFSYQFNANIGSPSSRKDNRRNLEETFVYDNLNRLQVMTGKGIDFDEKGNLTVMPNAGTLGYGNSSRPYQVTAFTPSSPTVTPREQHLHYNSFQRPDSIVENGITATLVYNTDGNRVKMKVVQGNQELLTRYYIDDEYELDGPKGVERLYLYGDAYDAPAVYIKEGGAWKLYYICRDYQGSITHIANADGTLKQELSYDAWGRLRNPQSQTIYEQGKEPELFLGRGYTGHEHLRWFGLINMNARLYDPMLGRFLSPDPYVQMPDFTQSFNRYSYCLNNPLKYVDKNGEFFIFTIINAVKDFVVNSFIKVWDQGFNAWSNSSNWHSTRMAFKIDMGLVKGNIGQILSRLTWELPQTALGHLAGSVQNTLYGVKGVSYYGGATAIEYYSEGWGAFTLGSFVNGQRGLQADPNNSLFQHEYGHCLQSQWAGLFYLQRYAIPSAIDAASKSNHSYHATEQDANIRAFKYFSKHVPNFEKNNEYNNIFSPRWDFKNNLIIGYNRTKSIDSPENQVVLRNGIMSLGWADIAFGHTSISIILNVLELKQ